MECIQKLIHFPKSDGIYAEVNIINQYAKTIVILPAIGVEIDKYQKLITGLNTNGFNTIAADYPGCGRNIPKVSSHFDYGYRDLLQDFIPQLINLAPQPHSQQNVILLGHSLGGHLATLYSQQHDVTVIGIATGNIGLHYWDLKGKIQILKAISVFSLLIQIYGYLPGKKVGFGNKEAKSLIQDWCKTGLTGTYDHILKPTHVSDNQALFIQMKGDEWAPISSLMGLTQYYSHPQIKQLDLRPSLQGNQHSVWIKQPEQVINVIQNWLN
ncbi:alpha/beta fold hydrolase [Acinetobacter ursingii]|uniref:alpha/beta fold hydrolase n=1 Tax=Acinetobacter ursingii TaxID=108980 RepID=UPI00124D9490|nr:alpha/beta fold hydrolase [Acinetobacter ursingii]MCU4304680.1 alpha/beta fold hydrolase [Acinetobacter ursingii]MCU4370685.1 alpha/beta fold hydrolase [Acinetobacter ursingii]MDG9991083.1 alpha/beta fold hydrolase [Acinetobacter ursingii]MDH0203273.1 alpha/beta fold hydrolase [Acinetobacter ursingii]